VAPLEMNAGTCWGKNKIGPRGRSVEKAPGSDFTYYFTSRYILFDGENISFGASLVIYI
jgi:hypothetical protein